VVVMTADEQDQMTEAEIQYYQSYEFQGNPWPV
jgi:hypothetical protein